MPQSPRERWSAPAKYYAELCDRARAIDPKSVIPGAASTAEITRLEALVARIEEQARKQAEENQRNTPRGIARRALSALELRLPGSAVHPENAGDWARREENFL